MPYSRRTWLQTLLGGFASVSLSSCRSTDPEGFDVCVVGSGPAGAILTAELLRRGVRTMLLEGGLIPSRRSRSPTEEGHISQTEPIDYPVDATRFMGDGGTTNLWTARCPRLQPFDFTRDNTYCAPDAPWPVTYDELEPFYARAERALSIAGGPSTMYSPPRSSGFPVDAVPSHPPTCLAPMLLRHGFAAEIAPESQAPRIATTHLPKIAADPGAQFVRDAKVVSIEVGRDGYVSGLIAQSPDGATRTFRARFYVLAMGGVETPRLLLRSRSAVHPNGVGNEYDLVGRYFTEHLWVELCTFRPPAWRSCSPRDIEQAVCWQFYQDFKRQGLGGPVVEFAFNPEQSVLTVSAVFEMKPTAANRVTLSTSDTDTLGVPLAEATITISDDERRTFAKLVEIARLVAAAARAPLLSIGDGEFQWAHHHMSTCRMGADRRTSVVDAQLRVHGIDNLYVSGSSTFVTGGAGSPTLLLSALTVRLADELARRVRRA